MVRGPEWAYVREIVAGKTASRLECKSCLHKFSGNAHRIKEHIFKIPGNVAACKNPPKGIEEKFPTWAQRVRVQQAEGRKKGALKMMDASVARDVEMSLGDNEQRADCSQRPYESSPSVPSYNQGACSSNPTGDSNNLSSGGSLHQAFDKQWLHELHLKWTQAFIACGISFNVIRNPIFKDALMSTAKKGFQMPDYNKMRTEYVEKVKASAENILKRTTLDYVPSYGCTIALDGWTNCQKKPLINVMLICPRGSIFLEVIDTSLKEKTSAYLAGIYERSIRKAGGPKNVTAIVTDNASNYKGAGKLIEAKYGEITWVGCAAHTLNLLLKDFGKVPSIRQTLLDANHIVKFVREHSFTNALFRSKSPTKNLQIFCVTRFATAYYVLSTLLEVKAALIETVADRRWDIFLETYPKFDTAATKCTTLVHSQTFWKNVEKVVSVAEPFVHLIRLVDKEACIFGRVYWYMHEACRKLKETTGWAAKERALLIGYSKRRWEQLHTPLHGAGFVLDPKFQMHEQSANNEVISNFRKVCAQLLGPEDGQIAYTQKVAYTNREGMFGDPWHIEAQKTLPAAIWWKEYGGDKVELQHVAVRVLSVAASSGSCERNWSSFDFIHTKKQNRLSVKRAADLVYVYCNMRLMHKPSKIATRASDETFGRFQTHDVVAGELQSDEELEWDMEDIDPQCSDAEEVDDMVPVFDEIDE